jgi:processive 1,2-diacylglycerol beta-glucosyltransferase
MFPVSCFEIMPEPRILILTLSHGASHRRAASAVEKALHALRPDAAVEVVDALERSAGWFRAYYNSYEIPLKYWPGLWAWIEGIQHRSESTGPGWLYRHGAQPLFRFIQSFRPDVVIATEVGVCELVAMHKRRSGAKFALVGLVLMDFNRAWVQPEVDLYPSVPGDMAEELVAAGVASSKILPCGLPIDPIFASLPDRDAIRLKLELVPGIPTLLVLFGGGGHGNPARILSELKKVKQPLQAVFVAGKNPRLEAHLGALSRDIAGYRVLGWVDNIHEWMAAADLLVSKPGGSTLMEAAACSLPMLAFDPLPGNEVRTCARIEKWGAGVWVKHAEDLAPSIERLLSYPEELHGLRQKALAIARPCAAHDAATAILKLCPAPRRSDIS